MLSVQNYAVYPRWRGELAYKKVNARIEQGLSPLTWGTL
ncbi:hypothetical protein AA98_3148 [Escherichia coli 2-011-08_S1_C1]|nr:hypothetical protein AA98_3148 [Escherichia coli 2-011-08_S1_C1]